MKPLRPKPQKEEAIQEAVRLALYEQGWTLAEKTHGNSFQKGWPDLFCFKPPRYPERALHRWVEVKRPTGSLTKDQRILFQKWEDAGLGVWVLTSPDEICLLSKDPNWKDWL